MIAFFQGTYYLFTGLWPIVHMQSFEKVTGTKTDKWLVKTLGLLISSIGFVVLTNRNQPPAEMLGLLSAFSLAAVDITYSFRGAISKVYLGDALVEICIITGRLI